MKRAIIIGASSGIGRELARILSHNGFILGLVARREELLIRLKDELPTDCFVKRADISQTEEAIQALRELINEMGYLDLFVINAGYGQLNPEN